MISKYVVECVFCEQNRTSRRTTVTVSATSHTLAIQKVTDECKRRFGKSLLLQTEIMGEYRAYQKGS
ncbi:MULTISPECIES: DUF3903 domain-containing protein [unclassified Bacillus cereus group]|uniref:DUF3903 domain-containing protein n=1 Tax=unclassified Bacillus cereus group TaxID=2750818 RepID=UPI001F563FF0|nr:MULTISPECIES: DUF3903 domain-containing protein [unclassified Bacillus cereus group]